MKYIDSFNGVWEQRPDWRKDLCWDLLSYNKDHIDKLPALSKFNITKSYSAKSVKMFGPLRSIETGEVLDFYPIESFEPGDNIFVEYDWLENNVGHVMTKGRMRDHVPGKVVSSDGLLTVIVALNFQVPKDRVTKNDFA